MQNIFVLFKKINDVVFLLYVYTRASQSVSAGNRREQLTQLEVVRAEQDLGHYYTMQETWQRSTDAMSGQQSALSISLAQFNTNTLSFVSSFLLSKLPFSYQHGKFMHIQEDRLHQSIIVNGTLASTLLSYTKSLKHQLKAYKSYLKQFFKREPNSIYIFRKSQVIYQQN